MCSARPICRWVRDLQKSSLTTQIDNQEYLIITLEGLLKLKGSNLARETTDETCHLPRPHRVARGFGSPAIDLAIVLFEPSDGMWRAPDVERLMAYRRSQQVAGIERRDRSVHDLKQVITSGNVAVLVDVLDEYRDEVASTRQDLKRTTPQPQVSSLEDVLQAHRMTWMSESMLPATRTRVFIRFEPASCRILDGSHLR